MSKKPWQVFLGFDPREAAAFSVARESIRRFHRHVPINGLVLSDLQHRKLYYRETHRAVGRIHDVISGVDISTEFSISRFLVPEIAKRMGFHGWSIFMDCDVLVRSNLSEMIELLDDDKALMCVQHDYTPISDIKMDGQRQYAYPRKNWSSVMAFNLDHEANEALTVEMVNTLPGRDLHRFSWLDDSEIGALPWKFNHLIGEIMPQGDPVIVHWTLGGPWLHAFKDAPYADEWRAELHRWAA